MQRSAVQTRAGFLPARASSACRLFYIHHTPAGTVPVGDVLYLHPFADEMNKARRMVARQGRALAARGWSVLLLDLSGCGDSEGDFDAVTWADWEADALQAARWLRDQACASTAPTRPLWLWGLRAGSLLASSIAQALPDCGGLLLWQPITLGKAALQQFLRLRTAGDMLAGEAAASTGKLRQQLHDGQVLHIAGYPLSPALAAGLEAAVLHMPAPAGGDLPATPVVWLDLSTAPQPTLSPSTRATVQQWQQAGIDVRAQVVQGPAFWKTSEIEDAPDLLQATLASLTEAMPAAARSGTPLVSP